MYYVSYNLGRVCIIYEQKSQFASDGNPRQIAELPVQVGIY